jgi:alkylhydroperoxidase/carboxymuconolactone decarboxylase family protein YurZ
VANSLEFEKRNLLLDTQTTGSKTEELAQQNAQQSAEIIFLKDRIKSLEGHLQTLKLKTDQFRKDTFTNLEKTTADLKQKTEENAVLSKQLAALQRETKALNTLSVDAVKSGWLIELQAGAFGKTQKRIWVVLNGVKFEQFKTDKDDKSVGLIPVDKCRIATLPEAESIKKYGQGLCHLIELTVEGGKEHIFFASDPKEKKVWLDALKSNKLKHVARADRATSTVVAVKK